MYYQLRLLFIAIVFIVMTEKCIMIMSGFTKMLWFNNLRHFEEVLNFYEKKDVAIKFSFVQKDVWIRESHYCASGWFISDIELAKFDINCNTHSNWYTSSIYKSNDRHKRSIQYARKIFQKTDISNLLIRTRAPVQKYITSLFLFF